MKKYQYLKLLFFSIPFFFISCTTTKVYTETKDLLYENGVCVSETISKEANGKIIESHTKTSYNLYEINRVDLENKSKIDFHFILAEKDNDLKSKYDEYKFKLTNIVYDKESERFIDANVIGTKTIKNKKNKKMKEKDSLLLKRVEGDKFKFEDEILFEKSLRLLQREYFDNPNIVEKQGNSYRRELTVSEVSVESTVNIPYVLYFTLGKPFVIMGASLLNLLECTGYAFLNFMGGFCYSKGDYSSSDSIWYMPSFKTAAENFKTAKEKKKIENYPEYHIPFTNNEIKVHETDEYAESYFITKDNVNLKKDTVRYLKNTMSVSLSASADMDYTAGVVGLIGTGITIPISVTSWVLGFLAGIESLAGY